MLVVSHPHQDHVAGLVDVLDRFGVRLPWRGRHPLRRTPLTTLLAGCRRRTIPGVHVLRTGEVVELDGSESHASSTPRRRTAARRSRRAT